MSVNKYISTVLVWLMCTSPLVVKPGKLGKRVKALEEKIKTLSSRAAFTVAAVQNRQYTSGDVVKFDLAIYNEGGHFDLGTNLFTCPVDGTYLFHTNLLAPDRSRMQAIIEVIGKSLSVYAHASSAPDLYNSGSNTVLTKCAKNQEVRVTAAVINAEAIGLQGSFGIKGYATTFSGVLVSPEV